MKSMYFVRVKDPNLEQYCRDQDIYISDIQNDFSMSKTGLSYLYFVTMDEQEALRMKLSYPAIGIVKFTNLIEDIS